MRLHSTGGAQMKFIRFIPFVIAAVVATLSPVPAAAQLYRIGTTQPVYSTGTAVRGTATAYDPVNNLYLVVEGYGAVYGVFVRSTGEAATVPFQIFDGLSEFASFPRVQYSPDVSNGAGGRGGFLVVWHQGAFPTIPTRVWSRVVAYEAPGRIVSAARAVSDTAEGGSFFEGWPAIAYSVTSKKFLVAWNTMQKGIRGTFVDTDGAPIGSNMSLQAPGYARDPSLAWNSATDEFGLFHSGWNDYNPLVTFRRVSSAGVVSAPRQFGDNALGTFATEIDVNNSHEYVMVWALHPGTMSAVFDQQGNLLKTAYVTSKLGFDLSLGFAFNATSGTFLTVGSGETAEIGAVEVYGNGDPVPGFLVATDGATNVGSFHPLTASRTGSPQWDISYAREYIQACSQIVGTSTVSGPVCTIDATATAPSLGVQGTALAFASTASTSGGCAGTAPTFSWNFGDGTAASTAQNPTHTYAAAGTYTWTLNVQAASTTVTKTGTISIAPPGLEGATCSARSVVAQPPASLAAMWQGTAVTVTAGQSVSITAAGTWNNGGQAFTASGNASDPTSGNSPMPGAARMALVGRIGTTGTPFLVGTSRQFTATSTGQLYLAPNDDWYLLWDNAGSLVTTVCVGAASCTVDSTATVPSTAAPGETVSFTSTATASGCSGTPTFSWNFGDGTAASTAQNPTHSYAATGTYTWTLTVTVGSTTSTKTGTITVTSVGTSGTCTPSSHTIVAQPPASLGAMWQGTGVTVNASQLLTITAPGTWTNGGQAFTAGGNTSDPTSGVNNPMPGAPRMALVGRIGTAGTPFLVGASRQLTASATGQLFLAPNDDWYLLWDNAGSLAASVCAGGTPCTVDSTATVPATAAPGDTVTFAATATASGCGATPTFSWNFGDGTAASTAQNPTHVYATAGSYSWTLTVTAGSTTSTKTGTITVGTAGACTPTAHTIVAQPPASLAAMWQGTGVTVTAGQLVTITATGTWINGGQSFTASGNASDPTSGVNNPMPGAPRMALVGRIGTNGVPFLVGASREITASASGELFLAPNDDWYLLWDNSGSLSASVCAGGTAPCSVAATATVPRSVALGTAATFVGSATPSSGCSGVTPTFSWNFGDGSAADTNATTTHAYSTAGYFPWALTVSVGSTTTRPTGNIAVCTPTTHAVTAQPPASLAAMWQSTGLSVTAGQVVTITAPGAWSNGGSSWTADGNTADITYGTNCPMPGAPRMALVARIGTNGTPFVVGRSLQFTAGASGELFLAPNDEWYLLWDNVGTLSVSVCK